MRLPLSLEWTLGEILADPVAGPLFVEALSTAGPSELPDAGTGLGVDIMRMVSTIPIGRMIAFSGGRLDRRRLEALLAAANAQ